MIQASCATLLRSSCQTRLIFDGQAARSKLSGGFWDRACIALQIQEGDFGQQSAGNGPYTDPGGGEGAQAQARWKRMSCFVYACAFTSWITVGQLVPEVGSVHHIKLFLFFHPQQQNRICSPAFSRVDCKLKVVDVSQQCCQCCCYLGSCPVQGCMAHQAIGGPLSTECHQGCFVLTACMKQSLHGVQPAIPCCVQPPAAFRSCMCTFGPTET